MFTVRICNDLGKILVNPISETDQDIKLHQMRMIVWIIRVSEMTEGSPFHVPIPKRT